MKKEKNDKRNIWPIAFDAITLIMATFGTFLFDCKILLLIVGGATCIILVKLLKSEFGKSGVILGGLISVILMGLMIFQIFEKSKDDFFDKVDEDVVFGNIEIDMEELIVEYGDEYENKKITSQIVVTEEICESVVLKCVDYDVVLEEYKIKDGKIEFLNIPVGVYDIEIELKGFSRYSGVVKLKEGELSNGVWNKTFCVHSDGDYKDFEIVILDSNSEILKGYSCDFCVLNTECEIKAILSDSEGKLPYKFRVPINSEIQLTLHYGDEIYVRQYLVGDIDALLYVQFSTPSQRNIELTESHKPNDAQTIVVLSEWNADKDIGNDGKRYAGGVKVIISDLFIELGANGDKDVVSRIIVPLDDDYDEPIFNGVFVLDQDMFGSNSTGTISIMVNDEVLFTTGKIDGGSDKAFPFNVNFGDADSIIIQTEAHLSSSAFVYGILSER